MLSSPPMLQKALFALAALVATVLLVALAWGATVLLTSGTIHLPKWAWMAVLAVVLGSLQLVRLRRRRGT
jgi:hypothetical protein